MQQDPITFNKIASQRHLNLNDCLKEALVENTSTAQPKELVSQKKGFKNRPSLNRLNLSYLNHHDRMLVVTGTKASRFTHTRKKKQPIWQKGGAA